MERIRSSAVERVQATGQYPLPLASHWNTGGRPDGFDAAYQLEALQRGRYLLPWIPLARPDAAPAAIDEAVVRAWARLRAPISLVSTQWEVLVAESLAGGAAKPPALSPDSPLQAWHEAGRRWGGSPQLRRLQAIYPDPPLVLFVSNNEQPKMSWPELRGSPVALPGLPQDADDEALRRAVGDAWIARYRALLKGFREALPDGPWRDNARFVGYNAFGQPAIGRWPGWPTHSLHTVDRLEPWSLAWDGASVAFYTSDWNPSSDFRVWSPQIESMNLVPMVAAARARAPGFWFELSTWDGRSGGLKEDKEDFYRGLGQQWTPTRHAGMVQFGLWLMRPRVVREFRDPQSPRGRYGATFELILDAIERVHDDAVLRQFWREGRLVANDQSTHPYQSVVPESWQSLGRWFLLETDANRPRPWALDTPIDVFALALEVGAAPDRQWLVYAFSPQHDRRETRVRIGRGIGARVLATQAGCFNRVRESGGGVEQLAC